MKSECLGAGSQALIVFQDAQVIPVHVCEGKLASKRTLRDTVRLQLLVWKNRQACLTCLSGREGGGGRTLNAHANVLRQSVFHRVDSSSPAPPLSSWSLPLAAALLAAWLLAVALRSEGFPTLDIEASRSFSYAARGFAGASFLLLWIFVSLACREGAGRDDALLGRRLLSRA